MNAQLNTKRLQGDRRLVSHIALALTLATAFLAGCSYVPINPDHVHLQQPIGRFALVSVPGGAIDNTVKEPGNQALEGAAKGALAAPVVVLQTTSLLGSSAALSAAAPVLAPLVVIGALAGATGGSNEPEDFRQAKLSAQSGAERAIAAHLAQRFGDRFTGLVPPTAVPATADTAFEVNVHRMDAWPDKGGNVYLRIYLRIRVFLPQENRELKTVTFLYEAYAHGDGPVSTTLNDELEKAWDRLANDIGGLVERSGT